MKKTTLFICTLLCVAACIFFAGCTSGTDQTTTTPTPTSVSGEQVLHAYCGAGLSAPMKEIGNLFKDQYGITVDYTFGGSGTLLSQMQTTKSGDLFMSGGTTAYNAAKQKGLVGDGQSVSYHIPLLVMPKGNPANITSIADLANPGVKLGLGDSNATAIGKQADQLLKKNGIYDAAMKNVVVRTATVNELITYVNLGQVDAAIIMADLYDPETMDSIEIPIDENVITVSPIGICTFSEQKDLAQKFIDFVVSDQGKAIFKKHNFVTYPDPAYANITG